LGDEAFDEAYRFGRAMTLDEAMAMVDRGP